MADFEVSNEFLSTVKSFVTALKNNPDIIHIPKLSFLKDYLLSVGAKLPEPTGKTSSASGDSSSVPKSQAPPPAPEPMEESDEEPEEPYPVLDEEGVIEPDTPGEQEMGNPDAAVSEEDIDKADELKREAVGLYGEGNFDESVAKYTEAIKLNGGSALIFAKRGQAFIQLGKPNACIRDCNRALQINPDSAVAYKFRGRAHRLLGHWHEAANDLRQACKIDFDEQADAWLKEVTPNARKVEEWQTRKHRQDEEKELKRRKRQAQERMKAHQEAMRANAQREASDMDDDFDMGGMGMPGMGGMGMPGMGAGRGAGGGIPGLDSMFSDPEVLELLSDPDVAAAFNDIKTNPMNIMKHSGNPKVAKLLNIMQKKMGGGMGGGMGMGGMPGMGGMGGMPGMGGMGGMPGGFGGGAPEPPKGPSKFSDDLD